MQLGGRRRYGSSAESHASAFPCAQIRLPKATLPAIPSSVLQRPPAATAVRVPRRTARRSPRPAANNSKRLLQTKAKRPGPFDPHPRYPGSGRKNFLKKDGNMIPNANPAAREILTATRKSTRSPSALPRIMIPRKTSIPPSTNPEKTDHENSYILHATEGSGCLGECVRDHRRKYCSTAYNTQTKIRKLHSGTSVVALRNAQTRRIATIRPRRLNCVFLRVKLRSGAQAIVQQSLVNWVIERKIR